MRALVAGLTLLVLLAAAGFAGYLLGVDAPDATTEGTLPEIPATIRVAEGHLEIVTFATVKMHREELGRVRGFGGTVTSLLPIGETVVAGTVVMTINLQPLVLLKGVVPMFRDIDVGSSGDDVAQIQEGLTQLGLYDGPVDGTFGRSTLRAWNRFLTDLSYDTVRVIAQRSVVFVSSLPARIDEVLVAIGDDAQGDLMVLTESDTHIVATVPVDATRTIAEGDQVEIIGGTERWHTAVARVYEGSNGPTVTLDAVGHLQEGTTLRARIISTVGDGGLIVPVSALYTDAQGLPYLRRWDPAGTLTNIPVEVVASTKDRVMVVGVIQAGDEVVVGR